MLGLIFRRFERLMINAAEFAHMLAYKGFFSVAPHYPFRVSGKEGAMAPEAAAAAAL